MIVYMYRQQIPICIVYFQRMTLKKEGGATKEESPAQKMRNRIIKRAALEFYDGIYGEYL